GRPYYPSSMIVEGMAQLGGLLIDQQSGFSGRVVLAKIMSSEFFFEALPGDQLFFHGQIKEQLDIGSVVEGTVHLGDKLQANVNLMFATLNDDRFNNVQLFEPAEFCRMIRLLKLFDVGVDQEGNPLQVPQHMLEAEAAWLLTKN
ncbi:MAG: beta-hydroxyacyl-ACP dehydratase, partial [Planctomycetota bacterium]